MFGTDDILAEVAGVTRVGHRDRRRPDGADERAQASQRAGHLDGFGQQDGVLPGALGAVHHLVGVFHGTNVEPNDAEQYADAVTDALAVALTDGELQDLKAQLDDDLEPLFEGVTVDRENV